MMPRGGNVCGIEEDMAVSKQNKVSQSVNHPYSSTFKTLFLH